VEEAAKAVHSPRVLHIDTRSFYLPLPHNAGSDSTPPGLDDPSLRAGLYFAGANAPLTATEKPPDVEDGILSAYEASGLDLNGTELVVLESPSSSSMPQDAREAVFEMPRAMVRAGAEAVLISLWPAPEKETAAITELFYKHWLSGDDKWSALRKAELETRAAIIKRTGKDDPSRWGSLVLVGR
jgi:CHAT domain-containing protein